VDLSPIGISFAISAVCSLLGLIAVLITCVKFASMNNGKTELKDLAVVLKAYRRFNLRRMIQDDESSDEHRSILRWVIDRLTR
jgi:hypothetical protein